jgi:ATP synthase protein I
MKKNDERYSWARQAGLLSTIPFLMAVPPIAGLLIGQYLDNRFDTNPVFTIVFLVFGFVAGVRETASVLKKANTENEKNEHDSGKKK